MAATGFPVDQVFAAGVGQIVIGGAVGRVAPDPDEVKVAVGTEGGSAEVGVHLALAIG